VQPALTPSQLLFKDCGKPSHISHWSGSRPRCLSNATSIANTIWKALDARAWNSRAGLIFQLARTVSEVLILTPAFNSRRDIAEPPAVSPTYALFLRRRNTRRWRRFALVIGPAEAVSLSLLAPRLRFCTR